MTYVREPNSNRVGPIWTRRLRKPRGHATERNLSTSPPPMVHFTTPGAPPPRGLSLSAGGRPHRPAPPPSPPCPSPPQGAAPARAGPGGPPGINPKGRGPPAGNRTPRPNRWRTEVSGMKGTLRRRPEPLLTGDALAEAFPNL